MIKPRPPCFACIPLTLMLGLIFSASASGAVSAIVAWGNNSAGQTNVPSTLSDVVAIGAGHSHSLALQADGTVAAWGDNYNGQTVVPFGLTNVIAIAGGGFHSLALLADGTVTAWGDNG